MHRDIFNADEPGLIYRVLRSGALLFDGEKSAGGKVSKDHLTALLSVNMDGKEMIFGLLVNAKGRDDIPEFEIYHCNTIITKRHG